jgi:hypothetical protein
MLPVMFLQDLDRQIKSGKLTQMVIQDGEMMLTLILILGRPIVKIVKVMLLLALDRQIKSGRLMQVEILLGETIQILGLPIVLLKRVM